MDERQPASSRDAGGYPRPIDGLTYRWMIACRRVISAIDNKRDRLNIRRNLEVW